MPSKKCPAPSIQVRCLRAGARATMASDGGAGAKGVVVAGEEELWGHDAGEEVVGVVAAVGVDGEAEGDEAFDADIAAAGAETDVPRRRRTRRRGWGA